MPIRGTWSSASRRLEGSACQKRLFHANFAEAEQVLEQCGLADVDGVLADLGLSTNQLMDERYGLSFAADAPLDMRIDPRTAETAADIVNHWKEQDIANLLYRMADERGSRRIARRIAERRKGSPIRTTKELAELVYDSIGRPTPRDKIDPATRTFMALRMAVNQETQNLESLLKNGAANVEVRRSSCDDQLSLGRRSPGEVGHSGRPSEMGRPRC